MIQALAVALGLLTAFLFAEEICKKYFVPKYLFPECISGWRNVGICFAISLALFIISILV